MNGGTHRLTLGRVAGVYGVRGWVKVQSYTRPESNLLEFPRWWLVAPEPYETQVLEGRVHGAGLVAWLQGPGGLAIEDRSAAAALVGVEVQVARSAMPAPAPGSYYWADLIGMEVAGLDGVPLGQVSGLLDNGAQDVLVVRDGTCERLIPFVHGPIIRSVDLQARRIEADWAADY